MSRPQRESNKIAAPPGVEEGRTFPATIGKRQREPDHFDTGRKLYRRRLNSVHEGTDDSSGRESSGSHQRDQSDDEDDEDEGSEPPPLRQAAPRRRPKKTIDWRSEICTFLDKPYGIPDNDLLDALDETSDTLREIEHLRKQASAQSDPPRSQIVHEITCHYSRSEQGVFLDPPTVVNYGPHDAHARSSRRITNMELFLERNKEITFLVYRQYECCGEVAPDQMLLHQDDTIDLNVKALLQHEYINIISPDLRKVMIDLGMNLNDIPFPDLSDEEAVVNSPYPWWFHYNDHIQNVISAMPSNFQEHIAVFECYLQEAFGKEWEIVNEMLSREKISTEFIHYLFVANEVIISSPTKSDVASLEGFCLRDWAKVSHIGDRKKALRVNLESSYWTFNGKFESREKSLTIKRFPSEREEFAIADLSIYPQRFASQETVRAMRERGRMFWKCRERHYIQAITQSDNGLRETAHSRFMVDTKTYNEMHPMDQKAFSEMHPMDQMTYNEMQPMDQKTYSEMRRKKHSTADSYDKKADRLVAEMMDEEDPDLNDSFFMCLPTEIVGFDMQKKEWVKLKVASIQDVDWNENAFELLVLEQGTKDLVEAVVTNRILAGEQTDVIQGKGNGLFLLLHGGPGTGKTLTAESVAEVAKRPLYRVTCGDIGTKAEEVEKIWECVVLLDEADVFLEQRELQQLERNALVSVFLRVLEYYDGILILTSNRVGTFDEAFKSRIQLSLRYNNLSMNQRRKIWENFIERLEILARSNERAQDDSMNDPETRRSFDVGIDTTGMRKYLDELARHELNGREIRNAISTARQLAMFRGMPMGYEHLYTVIIEANKFQKYIKDLNLGFTADQLSNERRER
ncbi:hypothetical protein E8E14_003520 [Neopestalotiopsis sp. 37M]|nr:hypothetical protein E8E14_003520 [Neopestalotiopsis sp. 37M]